MLVVLTGTSAAGKTAVLRSLGKDLVVEARDFDDAGVPESPSTAWRQRTLENWLHAAVQAQADERDFVLSAPSGLAELSAAPSMSLIVDVAVALIDADDSNRMRRLADRGPQLVAQEDVLEWASWFRKQFVDPRFELARITREGAPGFDWSRIDEFTSRITTARFETGGRTVSSVSRTVQDWILSIPRMRTS